MTADVIPINRERRKLIHTLQAAYSGHSYDVFEVQPPAQVTRKGSLKPHDAPFVVINSLNPRYYMSAHEHASEAIRAAQSIHDQHYREYLDVLAAEVNKRGYDDQDVLEVMQIMQATRVYLSGKKLRRPQRKVMEKLIEKHPADTMPEALQLHADRALKLWDSADGVTRLQLGIFHYIHEAIEGD